MTKRFTEIISTQRIVDNETGKEYYGLVDGGLFDLMNILAEENKQLKEKITSEKKQKENWAFIADCSVQVMNDEEEIKEEYLTVATNELKKMIEENEQLKKHLKALDQSEEATMKFNMELKKENDQLKQQNKKLFKMIKITDKIIIEYMPLEVVYEWKNGLKELRR